MTMLLDDKPKKYALVKSIINACVLVTKQLRLYGTVNRQIGLGINKLQTDLGAYFLYHESLEIIVARHGFIYDEEFVERSRKPFIDYAYTLFQHGISAIQFKNEVSPKEIQTFLNLINRTPAETWEEGGFSEALRLRGVVNIAVREMSEDDIEYLAGMDEEQRELLADKKSPLWERFARAILKGLKGSSQSSEDQEDDTAPLSLAELTNQVISSMSAASQQKFSKGVSQFLSSIQFEKVSHYRKNALAKLTEFINRIAPDVRARLFTNIFNANLKPTFSEEFFSGLSDEIIVELLENQAREETYVPPVIMKVLGKIAQERELDVDNKVLIDQQLAEKKNDIDKLFQKDDFNKYVPEKYRDALLNIIQHDDVTAATSSELVSLKSSLEDQYQERHTADIIIRLLADSKNEASLKGLDDYLGNIIHLYLEEGDYSSLNHLCELVISHAKSKDEFSKFRIRVTSDQVVSKVIQGINIYGKSRFTEIEAFIKRINTPFVRPLIKAIAEDPNRANRLYYLKLLQQLNPDAVYKEAIDNLDDHRWFFVRNMLQLLRNTQNQAAIPYLKPLADHPHAKVRNEALRTCLSIGCKDAIDRLQLMLADKNQETVDRAISLAIMVKDPNVAGQLVDMLRYNPVLNYRLEQKVAISKTLYEIAPKGALPVFFEMLVIKNTLHPNLHKQLQQEILNLFEKYNPEVLKPALRKYMNSTSRNIREKLTELENRLERS